MQKNIRLLNEKPLIGYSIEIAKKVPFIDRIVVSSDDKEILDMKKFDNIGIIKNQSDFDSKILDNFENTINKLKNQSTWSKKDILDAFLEVIPKFQHKETGIYLDDKM